MDRAALSAVTQAGAPSRPMASACRCRREPTGSYMTKQDRDGVPFYLHRADGGTFPVPPPIVAGADLDCAPDEQLHTVYARLLDVLLLSDRHRADLKRRGLTDAAISANGYRTLPLMERGEAVRRLVGEFPCELLLTVPGFFAEGGRLKLAGSPGLLIPCRQSGRIVAIAIRPDKPGKKGRKYVWLSSGHKGGCKARASAHTPLGTPTTADVVRLAEGTLKADVAAFLDGSLPCVGSPGLGWKRVIPVLREMQARVVRLAFDADWSTNEHVKAARSAAIEGLPRAGFSVLVEEWDGSQAKGIDNALLAGAQIMAREAEVVLGLGGAEPACPEREDHDPIHLTDRGNALVLVKEHGRDLRYCFPWGKWFVWDGMRWREDDTGEADRRAKKTVSSMFAWTVRKMEELSCGAQGEDREASLKKLQAVQRWCLKSEASARLNAMLDVARSEPGIPILHDAMDRDKWLLNCVNGTVDLRTGKLRPHDRRDQMTKLCPTPFDPKATAPTFYKFLREVFASDGDLIDYMCRLLGCCLTGDTREHLLAVFHGPGGNGKSVLTNTIMHVMGEDYSLAAMPDLLMAKRHSDHPTEIASLLGKRLLVCQETGAGRRLNEPLVKWLTGGDKLTARRMREDYWSFLPTHKAIVVTNHRPEVRGTDDGIWRRLRLIPFNQKFSGEREDTGLPDRLKAEAPGILAWCVNGCLEWQKHGMMTPISVLAATKSYRDEEDVIASFLAERCKKGAGMRCRASVLYEAFKTWQEQNGEDQIPKQKVFGTAMSAHGFTRIKSSGWWYEGIDLDTP